MHVLGTYRGAMIDWDVALKTAERMVPPGPALSAAEVDEVIGDLRAAAQAAEGPVRSFTGLSPRPAAETPVLIIDRARWAEANLASSRVLLEPVLTKLQKSDRAPSGLAASVGESINGMEIGALLSFMATKVLGQFEPFGSGAGRLLLVAPNIVHAERQLGVDPHDFRRWVCLHEETHRVQFTAVPWLGDHLRSLIADLAVAHFSGSLDKRFGKEDDGRGVVRAKTGTLTDVHSLAGVVTDRLGTPIVFAVMADQAKDIPNADAQDALDAVAAALARCTCSARTVGP
jgi:coenzyme F420 biosynthesis associated uncharacterized protein